MSSDRESEVVAAGSSAEDIVQREKVKRSSVWKHFQEKDDTMAECIRCHHEFKTKYCKYYSFITPFEAYASKQVHVLEKKLNRYKICRMYKMRRERLLNQKI